jgi:site-specific DNA recombinase
MNAAIYARRSKEQRGTEEKQKSITRQEDEARAFAKRKGWNISDEHVFVDDGISGAEFSNRPGFQRLLAAALVPKPPFNVLIVSEQKSIGREANETGWVVKQLALAGVQIFEYGHGRSLTPKNWLDKITNTVLAAADEAAQRQASERVHEAFTKKHRDGHVVGGRVFGYDNVCSVCRRIIPPGGFRCCPKSHTDRVVNPKEAAVVERIFEMFDSGLGLKRIAKILTTEGVPEPMHYKRNDGLGPVVGWCHSTVRAALMRPSYIGIYEWNKTQKRGDWGQRNTTDRPTDEWQRVELDHWKIIDPKLWQRVQSRRAATEGKAIRFASGRLSGRPPKNAAINLLAGLATCELCHGGLIVEHSNNRKGRYAYYICHRHRTLGKCTNALRMPLEEMNEAILQAVEEHALTPEAIESVIALSERDDVALQAAHLAKEHQDVTKRIARLVAAIEGGGEATALVAKINALEARQKAITRESATLRPIPRLAPKVIADRLAEWRRNLRGSVTQARAVLQRVIRGRITFTPNADEDGYTFEAPTRFDGLFSGIVVPDPEFGQRKGLEHLTDAIDADYGRLLENAISRKGSRARQDSNLRPPA